MQRSLLSDAVIGRRTAVDIVSPGGQGLLVPAGERLARPDVEALAARGVRFVLLQDELFPALADVTTLQVPTRLRAEEALSSLIEALGRTGGDPPAEETQTLLKAARGIVEDVTAADAPIADLGPWDHQSWDPVEHAVLTAGIAVQIGRYYPLPRDQLLRLCVGTLLMDVGLPSGAAQPGALDAAGVAQLMEHPREGWRLVHRFLPAIFPTSASVVLQHHERLDGSGYPEGRAGNDIYLFARIAAVADVFAAVRQDRPHRRRFRPADVLRVVEEEAGVSLDGDACDLLLRHVAIVPHGTIVRLTDGSLAKVVAHSIGAPLQPLVVVVGGALDQPVRRRQVNLRGTGLHVSEVLDAWPSALIDRMHRERPTLGA